MGRLLLHSWFRPNFLWSGEDLLLLPWLSDMALPELYL